MPENPITIRTMAPKGATQDQLLVHLQGILRARFATDLAIVNSPGRDGIDAAALAARDPLDGRHFLMTSAYSINYYPAYSDVGYRREDFEPVAAIGAYKFVHVTAAANPWRDLGEALAAVRGEGRALRFAGVGEVDLLMTKAMARRAGVAVEFKQTGGAGAARFRARARSRCRRRHRHASGPAAGGQGPRAGAAARAGRARAGRRADAQGFRM